MVTRILNLMGAYFGTENDGTGIVNRENPKGFWERKDVRDVNERILAQVGADWDRVIPWLKRPSPFELASSVERDLLGIVATIEPHRPWVVKDPRLCLTLAAWLPRLEMARLVMPLRHPIEVAISLQNRNGFPLDVGLALWEAYSLEALSAIGSCPVHLVRYEAMIENPVRVATALGRTLIESGVTRISMPNEKELMAFVDPSLYRSRLPDVGRYYHEHPAMALYAEVCTADAQYLSRLAGDLSARSANALAEHELRSRKAKSASSQGQRHGIQKGRSFVEHQVRKIEGQLSEAKAQLEQDAIRLADLEARKSSLEAELTAKSDDLKFAKDREAQLRELVAELRESLHLSEQSASMQQKDTEDLRQQLLAALGHDDNGEDVSLHGAIRQATQRLALQSAVSEHIRQTKKSEAQLRALVRQVRGLRQSARGVTVEYAAVSKAQKRVRESLGSLHASRSWQAGNRMMRLAEKTIGRESAWTVEHGKTSQALEQLDTTLQIGRTSAANVARASTILLNKSKEIAKRVEATAAAIDQLTATELFARHTALIEGGARERLRKLREAAGQDADIRARLYAERPLVSIIMPTYNRAALISEAIGSVLEQTYSHWELLVCDDGSTDDTKARVTQVADPRIRFLPLEHGGAAAARNSGLGRARGRYIAYLDSDNLWHPEFLLQVVGALVNTPGRLSAYSDYLDVDCKGGRYRLRQNRIKLFSYEELAERNYIDLNAFVHDAALPSVVGGFTRSLSRQQDWDLVLKIAYLRDPLIVDKPLMLYRRNAAWKQITIERKSDTARSSAQVRSNVAS